MRKFWVINIGKNPSISQIKEILKILKFDDINRIIDYFFCDKNCDPVVYLTEENKIIFSYNNGKFGWGELKDFDWYMESYEYCGKINIRNEKLKKLNEKSR